MNIVEHQMPVLDSRLLRSMPNADQYQSKSWHLSEMPLNASQCRSIPINSSQHWSELRGILSECGNNVRILIGIGHWLRESCIHSEKKREIKMQLDVDVSPPAHIIKINYQYKKKLHARKAKCPFQSCNGGQKWKSQGTSCYFMLLRDISPWVSRL